MTMMAGMTTMTGMTMMARVTMMAGLLDLSQIELKDQEFDLIAVASVGVLCEGKRSGVVICHDVMTSVTVLDGSARPPQAVTKIVHVVSAACEMRLRMLDRLFVKRCLSARHHQPGMHQPAEVQQLQLSQYRGTPLPTVSTPLYLAALRCAPLK